MLEAVITCSNGLICSGNYIEINTKNEFQSTPSVVESALGKNRRSNEEIAQSKDARSIWLAIINPGNNAMKRVRLFSVITSPLFGKMILNTNVKACK
jgi:hypothetical protein